METQTQSKHQSSIRAIMRYASIPVFLMSGGYLALVYMIEYHEKWEMVIWILAILSLILISIDIARFVSEKMYHLKNIGVANLQSILIYTIVFSVLALSVFWWWQTKTELTDFQLHENFYVYGGMTVVRDVEQTLYLKIIAFSTATLGSLAILLLRKKKQQSEIARD